MKETLKISDRFSLKQKLGQGTFSYIYEALDRHLNKNVALKVEKKDKSKTILMFEYNVLINLKGLKHTAAVYDFVQNSEQNLIVMDLLGINLAKARRCLEQSYNLKIAIQILIEMLASIQEVHERGFIHRDVKASNFVFCKEFRRVFIVDFGLAKKHLDSNKNPVPKRKKADFRGTVSFASLNAHKNIELARRDDIWSFYFTMLDFLNEKLEWREQRDYTINQVKDIKTKCLKNPRRKLWCGPTAKISEVEHIFDHIESLDYMDKPNYLYIKTQLLSIYNNYEMFLAPQTPIASAPDRWEVKKRQVPIHQDYDVLNAQMNESRQRDFQTYFRNHKSLQPNSKQHSNIYQVQQSLKQHAANLQPQLTQFDQQMVAQKLQQQAVQKVAQQMNSVQISNQQNVPANGANQHGLIPGFMDGYQQFFNQGQHVQMAAQQQQQMQPQQQQQTQQPQQQQQQQQQPGSGRGQEMVNQNIRRQTGGQSFEPNDLLPHVPQPPYFDGFGKESHELRALYQQFQILQAPHQQQQQQNQQKQQHVQQQALCPENFGAGQTGGCLPNPMPQENKQQNTQNTQNTANNNANNLLQQDPAARLALSSFFQLHDPQFNRNLIGLPHRYDQNQLLGQIHQESSSMQKQKDSAAHQQLLTLPMIDFAGLGVKATNKQDLSPFLIESGLQGQMGQVQMPAQHMNAGEQINMLGNHQNPTDNYGGQLEQPHEMIQPNNNSDQQKIQQQIYAGGSGAPSVPDQGQQQQVQPQQFQQQTNTTSQQQQDQQKQQVYHQDSQGQPQSQQRTSPQIMAQNMQNAGGSKLEDFASEVKNSDKTNTQSNNQQGVLQTNTITLPNPNNSQVQQQQQMGSPKNQQHLRKRDAKKAEGHEHADLPFHGDGAVCGVNQFTKIASEKAELKPISTRSPPDLFNGLNGGGTPTKRQKTGARTGAAQHTTAHGGAPTQGGQPGQTPTPNNHHLVTNQNIIYAPQIIFMGGNAQQLNGGRQGSPKDKSGMNSRAPNNQGTSQAKKSCGSKPSSQLLTQNGTQVQAYTYDPVKYEAAGANIFKVEQVRQPVRANAAPRQMQQPQFQFNGPSEADVNLQINHYQVPQNQEITPAQFEQMAQMHQASNQQQQQQNQ